MNFLKQIVDLLSKYEQKFDTFEEHELENTVYHHLYMGIQSGEYNTDDDAAFGIYKTDTSDARYRNLKSRLKKKLANNLFFLDIEEPRYSASLAAKFEVERQLFIMKTLADLGATRAAREVAIQILPITQKFHFTAATIESLTLLRQLTAYAGDEKELKHYGLLLKECLSARLAEIKASELEEEFKLQIVNTRSAPQELIAVTELLVSQIMALEKEHKTFSLFIISFRMQLHLCQLRGDYGATLDLCKQTDGYFQQCPHLATNARLIEVAVYKLTCYLYLRHYHEGIKIAEDNLHLLREGSGNWFVFMEDYFLILFHSSNLETAQEVYAKITQHISFQTIVPRRQETWHIFGLYLAFVEGRETPDMEKFIKDMDVYRADKSAVYVAVLALSILIILRNGDFPLVIQRDEYLKKYLSRYLKGDDHKRSTAFLQLLRVLIKKDFNLDKILKAGAKHIAVLHDETLRLDDYEVMPYERMWDIVVEVLKEKGKQAQTNADEPTSLP